VTEPQQGDAGRSAGQLSRRSLLTSAGGGVLGVALGGGVGYALGRDEGGSPGSDQPAAADAIPFYGERQAGIVTPTQNRLVFASFDVTAERASDLRDMLHDWTTASALMARGHPVGPAGGQADLPPVDTGEALGLAASRLTITVGFGPGLFVKDGEDRFGLASRRPVHLKPLERLPGDATLEPGRSDGDVCVQACADDPQVAFHAIRTLARIGRGVVTARWLQLGFGRTSATGALQVTPRNLQGFKDGTNNIRSDDRGALQEFVFAGSEEPQAWFRGGTYMVTRRIRMLIETWDRSSLLDQEQTIGRLKVSGAPIGKVHEKDRVDLKATLADGEPEIPVDAHIRLAGHDANGGVKILRRGYSFVDGVDPTTGELDAGLFFIAFQRDPHRGFATIQRRLATQDKLNEYIRHTSSALFAIPPGASPQRPLAAGLFAL
jgi:deferrochelatase/peroxidase EfeB